jgi:hypothetical protein
MPSAAITQRSDTWKLFDAPTSAQSRYLTFLQGAAIADLVFLCTVILMPGIGESWLGANSLRRTPAGDQGRKRKEGDAFWDVRRRDEAWKGRVTDEKLGVNNSPLEEIPRAVIGEFENTW